MIPARTNASPPTAVAVWGDSQYWTVAFTTRENPYLAASYFCPQIKGLTGFLKQLP
jgi:hypothetical protein